jgi:hypothetical protein
VRTPVVPIDRPCYLVNFVVREACLATDEDVVAPLVGCPAKPKCAENENLACPRVEQSPTEQVPSESHPSLSDLGMMGENREYVDFDSAVT